MTDGFDIVAVGVADECGAVARMVFRPQPRLVQDLCPGSDRGRTELVNRFPARRGEGDVRLPKTLPGGPRPDPEIRRWRDAVADRVSEIQHPGAAQRG